MLNRQDVWSKGKFKVCLLHTERVCGRASEELLVRGNSGRADSPSQPFPPDCDLPVTLE